jgi:hypothetical protein
MRPLYTTMIAEIAWHGAGDLRSGFLRDTIYFSPKPLKQALVVWEPIDPAQIRCGQSASKIGLALSLGAGTSTAPALINTEHKKESYVFGRGMVKSGFPIGVSGEA